MIAPKFIVEEAGKIVDLTDCVDEKSIVVVGIYNNGRKTREFNYYSNIFNWYDTKTKKLSLPGQYWDEMPCKYFIKYEADRPNVVKFTCDKKFPTHLKFRAMCTFDFSDDGITLIDIEDGEWISDV